MCPGCFFPAAADATVLVDSSLVSRHRLGVGTTCVAFAALNGGGLSAVLPARKRPGSP